MLDSTPPSFPPPVDQQQAIDDDDATIVTSNRSTDSTTEPPHHNPSPPDEWQPPTSPVPIPTPTSNYFACLADDDEQGSNDDTHYASTAVVPPYVGQPPTPHVHNAVSDSGATGHFLVAGAPAVNIRRATDPIHVTLPDGSKIHSSHTCNLDIPWLPSHLTEAHILPGLAHSSLISTRKFCDAGCQVVFDQHECRVYHQGDLVLLGGRDKKTGLWQLPINPNVKPDGVSSTIRGLDLHTPSTPVAHHAAHNVYTLPYKRNQLKYMHQSLFNPPIPTLLRAIQNEQLEGFPFMKADTVRKYLAPSPATPKGRMKRTRAGIRSTRKKPKRTKSPPSAPNIIPDETADGTAEHVPNGCSNVFCFAALADKVQGTIYTDATGHLPVKSLEGHQYYFVAYDYDTNYIFAIPIRDVKDATIIAAFDEVFQELTDRGYKPRLNVTDNQATTPLKAYLQQHDCKWQFVEPTNHRVNAAERAIQTFKNHFISGLCSTDSQWPLQLWDHLTTQALITLNVLRTSRIDPTKSAYHQLHGKKYDWNAHPLAPPGSRAVIYEDPNSRTSWGTRGVDAWYCGPALDHYRNMSFYVPTTRSMRISGTYELFPQHCLFPQFTPDEHASEVFDELAASIPAMSRKAFDNLTKRIESALLEHSGAAPIQRVEDTATSLQRVETEPQRVDKPPPITTTTNPTAPRELRTNPRTHARKTRRNTPRALPLITTPPVTQPSRGMSPPTENPSKIPTPIPTISPTKPSSTPMKSPASDHPMSPHIIEDDGTTTAPTPKPLRRSHRTSRARARLITQTALNLMTTNTCYEEDFRVWTPRHFLHLLTEEAEQRMESMTPIDIEHFCAPVVHPITGDIITKYNKLYKDPALKEDWIIAFGKEFGNIAQGDELTGTPGTNCVFVMSPEDIPNIPKDRVVTYASIAVDYRPQKEDPNRVRITAGGNLIKYPHELTTRTADLTTSKILWNSVVSTEGARFMCLDISSFYLCTPMDRYEYMKIPLELFPEHIRQQYKLYEKNKNGFVYLEIRRAIYGLPQGGILANKLLRERLAPHGYYEVAHTPGLWRHVTRPIQFSLIVDDFGVKYVGKEHADHLLGVLRKWYKVSEDWEGKLYAGITLDWNYDEGYVDISMPGYITKLLARFKHEAPKKPQHSPHPHHPKKFGSDAQDPLPPDDTPRISQKRILRIQQVVGAALYYARAVDMTILTALSSIASEQAQATERTVAKVNQLLDYLSTKPKAVVRFTKSNMILNIHSDASYLSESRARSRVAGQFFLGSTPEKGVPIKLNGSIHVMTSVLKFVVASAAEAELAALFLNCKEGKVLRLVLEELGHPQPPTSIHCDNKTAAGIANDTVKKQRSRSMEMRFFWVTDQTKQGYFNVEWHPGKENLADYFTKHFDGKHHMEVRPWYLHETNSPSELPRAAAPSTLRGCVGTLADGYVRSAPLPRLGIPTYRAPRSAPELTSQLARPVMAAAA